MEATEKVLKILESLSTQDRRWVIEHLPDSAKERLITRSTEQVQSSPVVTETTRSQFVANDERSLYSYAPSSVGKILEAEPAWIAEAILRSAPLPWRKQVLQCLSPSTRSAVLASTHTPPYLAKPIRDALREAACSRLSALPSQELAELPQIQSIWKRWFAFVALKKWMNP